MITMEQMVGLMFVPDFALQNKKFRHFLHENFDPAQILEAIDKYEESFSDEEIEKDAITYFETLLEPFRIKKDKEE